MTDKNILSQKKVFASDDKGVGPMSDHERYDCRTIALHWLSAAAILTMWLLEQFYGFFPRPQRYLVLSTHISLGVILVVLIAARLSWRFGGGRKLPPADPGLPGKAAVGVHHLLYLLIIVTICLGLIIEAARGDFVYHLVQLPILLDMTKDFREQLVDYHALAADSLIVFAGLHAAAALWHHFVKRDGVLMRMR